MNRLNLAAFIAALTITSLGYADMQWIPSEYASNRVWTSVSGTKLEGQLIEIHDKHIIIRKESDFKEVQIPLERFSAGDLKFIESAKKLRDEITERNRPKDVLGFRDLKWGEEISRKSDFTLVSGRAEEIAIYIRPADELLLGDISLKYIHYETIRGRLSSVTIGCDGGAARYEDLRKILVSRYGSFHGDDYSALWGDGKGTGGAFLRRGISETYVMLYSESMRVEREQIESKKATEAAKTGL